MKHEQWTLDRWKSVLWSDESKFEIFGSNSRVFLRCRVGEQMISPCVVPTEAWRSRCGGALLVTLSGIYLEFKARLTSMATIICFSTRQWPNTPPGCVRAIWPRRRLVECCIRCPGLHIHQTSIQLRLFGMSWTAEWRNCSKQVLNICGNSFKTVGKAFQVKLVEKNARVCKAVIKARVATFDLTLFCLLHDFICYFIVWMSSLLF